MKPGILFRMIACTQKPTVVHTETIALIVWRSEQDTWYPYRATTACPACKTCLYKISLQEMILTIPKDAVMQPGSVGPKARNTVLLYTFFSALSAASDQTILAGRSMKASSGQE